MFNHTLEHRNNTIKVLVKYKQFASDMNMTIHPMNLTFARRNSPESYEIFKTVDSQLKPEPVKIVPRAKARKEGLLNSWFGSIKSWFGI
jgi:hypothetical protein